MNFVKSNRFFTYGQMTYDAIYDSSNHPSLAAETQPSQLIAVSFRRVTT